MSDVGWDRANLTNGSQTLARFDGKGLILTLEQDRGIESVRPLPLAQGLAEDQAVHGWEYFRVPGPTAIAIDGWGPYQARDCALVAAALMVALGRRVGVLGIPQDVLNSAEYQRYLELVIALGPAGALAEKEACG